MKPINDALCKEMLPILRQAVRHQAAMWDELIKLEELLECRVESRHLYTWSFERMKEEDFERINVKDARHLLEELQDEELQ